MNEHVWQENILLKVDVRKKSGYTTSVIHFVPTNRGAASNPKLSKFARVARGKNKRVQGVDAVQSYVTASCDG